MYAILQDGHTVFTVGVFVHQHKHVTIIMFGVLNIVCFVVWHVIAVTKVVHLFSYLTMD